MSGITATIAFSDIAAGRGGFLVLAENTGDSTQGIGLTLVGDVNGDGIRDLGIEFPAARGLGGAFDGGSSFVLFGRGGDFGTLIDLRDVAQGQGGFVVRGAGEASIGTPTDAGDLNSDGIADLAIVASGSFNVDPKIYVLYGRTDGFDPEIDLEAIERGEEAGTFILPAPQSNSESGGTGYLAPLGDVNGDGLNDFAVAGITGGLPPGRANQAIYVVFGQDGGVPPITDLESIAAGGRGAILRLFVDDDTGEDALRGISTIDDVNGDGVADLQITTFTKRFVLFGGSNLDGAIDLDALDGTRGVIAEPPRALFAFGDVNGDGLQDTFGLGVTPFSTGVFLARPDGSFAEDPDIQFRGPPDPRPGREQFGFYGIGDFNGDGIDDFIADPYRFPPVEPVAGEEQLRYVVYGSRDGFPAVVDLTTLGTGSDGANGLVLRQDVDFSLNAIRRLGDLNGDGAEDLAFVDTSLDAPDGSRPDAGGAYIIYGRPVSQRGTAAADTLVGTAADNAFTGLGGNDLLQGGAGDDTLRGGPGRDTLDGGAGDDQLRSGGGADVWTGGAGRDGFLLLPDAVGAGNAITITDFARAEGDSVNLSRIDADALAAGDQAFAWIGRARFSGQAGELRWDRPAGAAGRDSRLLGDTDGDGVADVVVLLEGVDGVRESWFVL